MRNRCGPFAVAGAFAVMLAATMILPALAQQPPAAGGPTQGGERGGGRGQQAAQMIKQVKPGFYMVTGAGGNTSVRVASSGLILVDTKNLGDAFYNALIEQVKTVSAQPVKYVFVTHHHQDHSGNIGPFQAAGAEVIVQENLNKNLETYAPAQGKPEMAKVTYTKGM